MPIMYANRPQVKPHRRTPRPPAPFGSGVFGRTLADELWWLPNAPEIDREHPDRFVLTTWCGRDEIDRKGYGDERTALIAASVTADPLQFEDETVEWSDDANGQFGYQREMV